VPDYIIDLSKYVDISKYTIYDGAHVRLSSNYRVSNDPSTHITVVDDPGIHMCSEPDRRKFSVRTLCVCACVCCNKYFFTNYLNTAVTFQIMYILFKYTDTQRRFKYRSTQLLNTST